MAETEEIFRFWLLPESSGNPFDCVIVLLARKSDDTHQVEPVREIRLLH